MSDPRVHLDFESRATVAFGKGGVTAYQYARHPNTDLWCMSWCIGDGEIALWDPWNGDLFPDDMEHALKQGLTFVAHNAGFEWCIWNFLLAPRYGLPKLPFEQMDCTAARAAIMALPRDLAGAAKALGLAVEKDDEGRKLMMKMAKPRRPRKDDPEGMIRWWDEPENRKRLGQYCVTDTVVERELDRLVEPMAAGERKLWLLDHRTNMRGVQIDVPLAVKAEAVSEAVLRRYENEMFQITGGECTGPTDMTGMKSWIGSRGFDTSSLAKDAVIELLDETKDADPQAHRLLQLRQEAGKSSVAKLVKFQLLSSEDHRARENFMHHGANTGRAAGKGIQMQNLPSRGGLKWQEAEQVIELIHTTPDPDWAASLIEIFYGPVPVALSSILRGIITAAPRKMLYCADFSNIEGRVAAWLGDEKAKLQAFRDYDTPLLDENGQIIPCKDDGFKRKGPDLYKVTAGSIVGVSPWEIDKILRNILGKVPELALGFGGGVGAFVSMGANYNVNMADYWPTIQKNLDEQFLEKAHDNWNSFGSKSGMFVDEWLASEAVKLAWRARHPGIVRCWREVEDAGIKALQTPGKWFKIFGGRCAMGAKKINGITFLISRMPNGRKIYRANAKLKSVKKFGRDAWEIHFWGVNDKKQWVPMSTYGGDMFQSFVQGIARDIMMNGWQNAEDDGFGIVLQVHDELAGEADEDRDLDDFESAMIRLPEWATGLPVSAAGYKAFRYRKD